MKYFEERMQKAFLIAMNKAELHMKCSNTCVPFPLPFLIHLKQLPLAFKQPSLQYIHSNSGFSQKRLQQVLYIAVKEPCHRFPDY